MRNRAVCFALFFRENRFDRMKILVTMLDQNLADMDSGRLDEHKKARFKKGTCYLGSASMPHLPMNPTAVFDIEHRFAR